MLCTRRSFLLSGAGGMIGGLAGGVDVLAQAADRPPIVDCHTHFYDPTRPEGIPWPSKDDDVLYRPVLPRHFLEQGTPLGVTQTVVIEASPRVEDNAWLLELAAANRSVVGVVGNLAPGKPQFAEHLQRFAANKRFRGIRVGGDVVRRALEQPETLADVRRLAERDLELDVIGGPEMPADVARLADKLPDFRIVINHLAGVSIDGKAPPREWLAAMREAAKRPKVYCKVSALVALARPPAGSQKAPLDLDFYRPILDATWEAFSDDRLIYGSDWPVIGRFATYREAFLLIESYVRARGAEAATKFFSTNAQAAYRWPKG